MSDFALFYALMPGDNPATVVPGGSVEFPQDGPSSGTVAITRASPTAFVLGVAGTYEVTWQVSVSEGGQLELALDAGGGPVALGYTVVGRAAGTTQLVGSTMVKVSVPGSRLMVTNPVGTFPSLTVTPFAGGGGARPVSASLSIKRIQ